MLKCRNFVYELSPMTDPIKRIGFDTTGDISDYLPDDCFSESAVREFLCQISHKLLVLKEEGKDLFPSLLLTRSYLDVSKRIGPNRMHVLGRCKIETLSHKNILKHLGASSSKPWIGFIEIVDDDVRYGVFCPPVHPMSIPILELVPTLEDLVEGNTIVTVRRAGVDEVQICAKLSETLSISSARLQDAKTFSYEEMCDFAKLIVSNSKSTHAGELNEIIRNMIVDGLETSHGTIIAVVPDTDVAKFLEIHTKSHVLIEPPIDLVREEMLQTDADGGSYKHVIDTMHVVRETIGSDGITVFSDSGKLVAFRAIVDSKDAKGDPSTGSRSLAFRALCAIEESGPLAVLFRSQDGHSEIKIKDIV